MGSDARTITVTGNEHRILDYLLRLAYESPETFGAESTVRATDAGRATQTFTAAVHRIRNKLGKPPSVSESEATTEFFFIIYSLTLRRTLVEQKCATWKEAFTAQVGAMRDRKWRGRYRGPDRDITLHIFSGPSREFLVRTEPKYFPPPRGRVSR